MNLLLDYLGRLPQRDLRAIATRIGVRKADSNRKQAWVLAVHRFQLAPDAPAFLLGLLSPSALQALNRLLGADALPTALFLAEYGPVRRAGVNRSWSPSPWQQPASVSEELYYAGLLFPADPKPIERSRMVTVPPDLRRHLAPQFATLRMTQARPFPLLHDLVQVLFYLHQHPDLSLQHGRWLSPYHVAQLNQRLLNPDPPPLPTSHKRSHRLRFLFFLAQAAGLLAGSEVTAFAWFWAAESPAQQMTLLWQAWLGASTDLRRFYVQPGSYLPAPWPHLLVKQLAEIPMPCSPDQLTARILAASPAFQGFFLAYLEDLSQLDALIADILADPLAQLSVTFAQPDQASPDPAQAQATRRFSLTPTGRWLLQPTQAALPDGLESWPNPDPSGQAMVMLFVEEETEGWLLSLDTTVAPHRLLPLAPFVEHLALDRSGPVPHHRLKVGPGRLAQAAAQGHELAALFRALDELGIALSPAHLAQLAAWHGQGRQLALSLLPVLRSANPESLQAVLGHAAAAKVIREVLTPTLAVLDLPLPQALGQLATAGFFAQSNHADLPQAADPEATPDPGVNAGADVGMIWLTGQVYALLARHLPLPTPPFRHLAALFAQLLPTQQAGLTVQLDRIQADLGGLLDGLVFTPPPNPTDPARWQPILRSAIEDEALLTMDYFVAGRNLLTHRTVQPHFLEERKGVLYLRAYCHSAGRVLSFRLDRIQGLTPVKRSPGSDADELPPVPA